MESKIFNIRHRCFFFAKEIVLLTKETVYEKKFFPLFDQLLRSGTSIGANVVEGYAGSSSADFVRYMNIALKSANETKYWLCLLRETMAIPREKINKLIVEADQIGRILASIIINRKSNKHSN